MASLSVEKNQCISDLRLAIVRGQEFFQRHPELFQAWRFMNGGLPPELYEEAAERQMALNRDGIKRLLHFGGAYPSDLFDRANKLLEQFELAVGTRENVNGGGLYTYYCPLATERLPQPFIDSEKIVSIQGVTALRSALVARSLVRSEVLADPNEVLEIREQGGPFTVHDVLRVHFGVLSEGIRSRLRGMDLGWVLTDYDRERMYGACRRPNGDIDPKWIEGAARRQFEAKDVAVGISEEAGFRGYSVSFMAEERTDTGLRKGEGEMPSFFGHQLFFGRDIDFRREMTSDERVRFGSYLRRQITGPVRDVLLGHLVHEVKVAAGIQQDQLVRGGREGTNVYDLWKHLSKKDGRRV